MSPDTPIDDPSVRLPRPFVAGLQSAGITTLGAAWAKTDQELLALHGVGAKGIGMLRALRSQ
jgi:hypothetical protein